MNRLILLNRVGAASMAFVLSGCANHPLDCSLGISHPDCLPGTRGYETVANQQYASDAQCRSYGLRYGTPEYAQCRLNVDNQQAQRETVATGVLLANRPQTNPVVVPPVRQPIQTTCVTNGQQTNCQTQ
jgi:hypothetical protein